MRYGSMFSGIEAATVAWHPLGWEPAWFAEIEPFPSAVLKHHYPSVPNLGDINKVDWNAVEPVDLIVGGSPCQSFSVAGKRLGLDDPRGNMALVMLGVVQRLRPKWLVYENVPGLLSSDGGRDFGAFLGLLGELGYGFAYRILDSQFFGVPQRRRRVFVVGCLGDWRRAVAVLFERHSLQGHSPPRRETGEGLAPTISARPTAGGGLGTDFDCDGGLIPADAFQATGDGYYREGLGPLAVSDDNGSNQLVAHALRGVKADASEDGTGRGTPLVAIRTAQTSANGHGIAEDVAHTLDSANGQCIAFSSKDHGADAGEVAPTLRSMGHDGSHPNGGGQIAVAFHPTQDPISDAERSPALGATAGGMNVNVGMAVRRLTPVECARLQGFPDDYLTQVIYRGKPAADGPMYKALGNSMAVPVVRWLGKRIDLVDALSAVQAVA